MSIKSYSKIIACAAGLLGLTMISASHATPVSSISFSNLNMQVHRSAYQVTGGDTSASLMAAFNAASPLCNVALVNFTAVGGPQNCGTPTTDLATLYTVDYNLVGGPAMFELGADWGRGGMIMAVDGGNILRTDNIWWNYSWNNSDVLHFSVSAAGSGSFQLLGFENGYSGYNSLRVSLDGGRTFSAVVDTPEPAPLALLGLGLIGLTIARKRRKS